MRLLLVEVIPRNLATKDVANSTSLPLSSSQLISVYGSSMTLPGSKEHWNSPTNKEAASTGVEES